VHVGEFARGRQRRRPAGNAGMSGNDFQHFAPYPGFVCDPYREYSEPWVWNSQSIARGSFATPARLISNTWRNFYTPDRGDIFAGFRTCPIE